MRKLLVPIVALSVITPGVAEGHPVERPVAKQTKYKSKYRWGCNTKSCLRRVQRKRMKRYIRPYRGWFLGPVGACESSTTTNLKHGLRAVSPSGQYRGRYQFGMPDWRRAGGTGDPINADWLTQAYFAVRWLHINGRSSWPNC